MFLPRRRWGFGHQAALTLVWPFPAADFFLVFDVGAGSELWGRLGHDRIYRPVGEAYLEYAERFAENDTDTSVRKRCR